MPYPGKVYDNRFELLIKVLIRVWRIVIFTFESFYESGRLAGREPVEKSNL